MEEWVLYNMLHRNVFYNLERKVYHRRDWRVVWSRVTVEAAAADPFKNSS